MRAHLNRGQHPPIARSCIQPSHRTAVGAAAGPGAVAIPAPKPARPRTCVHPRAAYRPLMAAVSGTSATCLGRLRKKRLTARRRAGCEKNATRCTEMHISGLAHSLIHFSESVSWTCECISEPIPARKQHADRPSTQLQLDCHGRLRGAHVPFHVRVRQRGPPRCVARAGLGARALCAARAYGGWRRARARPRGAQTSSATRSPTRCSTRASRRTPTPRSPAVSERTGGVGGGACV